LQGCGKGNSDLFKPQAQFCNADFDQQGDTIKVLKEMIDHIATRGQEGINSDCSIMSDLHPFAEIAWLWVQPGRLDGKRYHLFTDGSCKDGRATWAFIAILETQKEGHVTFCRVGFAAGDVNEDIGPCDQPSLDAESTALIAMMEYALTLCDIPDVHLFCHFDAMAVGFAAMGANHRQRDAGSQAHLFTSGLLIS
jgi:hypothetical protein